MADNYLSLEQNLCGAKIFLNMFNLKIEEKDIVYHYDRLKIYDKNEKNVGEVYFNNGFVYIKANTLYGKLNASYEIGKFYQMQDIETDNGLYSDWNHNINFKLGNKIKGDLQMHAVVDTTFGINFRTHTILKYKDKEGKNVELLFMRDGKAFSYTATKDDFLEELKINPWNDFEPFLCHTVRSGEYSSEKSAFENQRLFFVWHNGCDDRKTLRTVSRVVDNYEYLVEKETLTEGNSNTFSKDAVIEKAKLMHKIDDTFANKINDIIKDFKTDDCSLIESLISFSFDKFSQEEINTLFGLEIKKANYYNGTNNIIDAYFDVDNNKFLPKKSYKKLLSKRD